MRTVRICYFNTWADALELTGSYLDRVPQLDLAGRVEDPQDDGLLRKARLDCDWYAENTRCFAAMQHRDIRFLPAFVAGRGGVLEYGRLPREENEERWVITMAHQPQALAPMAGRVFAFLRLAGIRILYYAFDEASGFMPCFREIAPHLDVLIHDEAPLEPAGEKLLRSDCRRIHRSWVANFVPFAATFNPAPEQRVLFLGSKLGLTPHRLRQIEFLRRKLKDRFVPIHDHSVSIADRFALNRFKVGVCPEGRKFATPSMSRSHTDRPFWSGCLGQVPVSENSRYGDRLDELAAAGLIVRYRYGDLSDLVDACEQALACSESERRRIYEHFNRQETVGTVVAAAIAAA